MGLLLFVFFVVPYFGLAFWVWWETVGVEGARNALLGTAAHRAPSIDPLH